ncbi:MAG: C10 family peptidase, partial [Pedobacter sp.]|nr:C10 family peptidase [Pedobacter sp.]
MLLLWSSCKRNAVEDSERKSESSIVIPVDVAKQMALGFAKFRLGFQGDRQNRELGDVITYNDGAEPALYVFNYKDQKGYVVISAEAYEHPILGYNEKGTINKELMPCGLTEWIQLTVQEIADIRDGKLDTKDKGLKEWSQLAAQYDVPVNRGLPPPEPPCEDGTTYVNVGPLISTTWGQGCNYNDFCPTTSNSSLCYHAPTGCVATAMAQVLKFWSAGSTYSWSSMPNNFGTTATATLMANAGAAVGMGYGVTASSAYLTAVPWGLVGGFGYSSATHTGYGLSSYSMVQSQLNAGMPVILGGQSGSAGGHAWVCDGYSEGTTTICNPTDGVYGWTSLYFHMNWGWDGASDGYYAFSTWAPYGTGYSFSTGREAVVNIHP